MLNKDLTYKNFTIISETPLMDDPAQNPQNVDSFSRELAVALRRILGITESADMELPTVIDQEPPSMPYTEITHD